VFVVFSVDLYPIDCLAARADSAREKAFGGAVGGHYASATRPLCRNRGSTLGSRPRKLTNSCMGSREPPRSRISCKKRLPVCGLNMPSSSKAEKASALNTSAHL